MLAPFGTILPKAHIPSIPSYSSNLREEEKGRVEGAVKSDRHKGRPVAIRTANTGNIGWHSEWYAAALACAWSGSLDSQSRLSDWEDWESGGGLGMQTYQR